MGPTGLPIGLQMVARVHEEMACLRLAAAYEAADPWWLKRLPPLLASGARGT
jgi:Asp-tRNA(Asn)/Glu-tRNA(Gln) amidotransferase A subunit family amidase